MLFVELAVKGLVYGCMYAMMAVGLTLVYGLLRILHIAHAGVFALGAYMAVMVANATGSLASGFLVAMVVSALAGVAIYRLAYQPILHHPPFVPMIVSIGMFIVMQEGFRLMFGAYGIAFDHNPWYVAQGRVGRHQAQPGRDRDGGRVGRAAGRFRPVRGPDARRHRLARHGDRSADGDQLRRRSDPGALPQFLVRLGAGRHRRRAGRRC